MNGWWTRMRALHRLGRGRMTVEEYEREYGEPWCPEHGYGCEPSDCPCGHTLRCDCREIANEH